MEYSWRGSSYLLFLFSVLVLCSSWLCNPCLSFQLSKLPSLPLKSNCRTKLNESIQIWLDCRLDSSNFDGEENNMLAVSKSRVEESDVILVSSKDRTAFPPSKQIFSIDDGQNLLRKQEGSFITKKGGTDDGSIVGKMVNIAHATGLFSALAAIGTVEWVLAILGDDMKMLPAENLVQVAKSKGTKITMTVERAEDMIYLSRALELGVHALCVPAHASVELWTAVLAAREKRKPPSIMTNVIDIPQKTVPKPNEKKIVVKDTDDKALQPVIVTGYAYRKMNTKTGNTVIADRVCIDFVQKLTATEGCWVGSSTNVVALVLSEAATSSFVPSRPFRVNAGPIHSDVILSDGVTSKYLCDLQPGDEVLVYDCEKETSRSVVVGRLKIEVRPCVMIGLQKLETNETIKEVENGDIFLQQAETVRLGKGKGQSVKVTELVTKKESSSKEIQSIQGDKVLLRIKNMGTSTK